MKEIVAVDFDGTLTELGKHSLRSGAKAFLQMLNNLGFVVVVFTANAVGLVRQALEEGGVKDLVHDVTNTKPHARAYVDDRAVHFDGNYSDALAAIKKLPSEPKLSYKEVKK